MRFFSSFAATLLASGGAAQSCVSWRQTGGCSPDGPRERRRSWLQTGYSARNIWICECENGRKWLFNLRSRRVHLPRRLCVRRVRLLEGSVWYWNDWRDVEFRKDNVFYAPDGNCDNEECSWKAKGTRLLSTGGTQAYIPCRQATTESDSLGSVTATATHATPSGRKVGLRWRKTLPTFREIKLAQTIG